MSMLPNPNAIVLDCKDKSLALQSAKDECDVNVIMKKYEKSGLITHMNTFEGFYADVSAVPSLADAFHVVEAASAQFMELPADLRARFENDPEQYLAFVMNPDNRDEMIKLGMIEKPKEGTVVVPPSPPLPVQGGV